MFKTKVIGTQTVLSAIKSSKDKAEKIIADELNAFGLMTVNDAKSNAPVDEGTLRNAISYAKDKTSVTIAVNVDYAAYQEFGTRSFVKISPGWEEFAAQFKGSQRALSMLANGVKPHPYLIPAVEKNRIELIKQLKAQL